MQLSEKEQIAMNRYHLGGSEALRTGAYLVASRTIGALMKKGYFDKVGLTGKGKAWLADNFNSVTSRIA